jgi:ABC-2 type transport system ATP-binding protein
VTSIPQPAPLLSSVPSPGKLAIDCRGLVKRYEDVVAVAGLDLQVRAGECFGLLGPNGAGKTTTIEILEGLNDPTEGEVTLLGRRWKTDEQALRERLGITLQETHLPDRLKVREILQLFRSFYRRGPSVDALVAAVGLQERADAWYTRLSGGQKQRLAVACALVGDPELLFLDEPTTGLDPQSRRNLWDIIAAFRERGGTVLITTHYMEEADRLCDRVGIIDRGRMVAVGTPNELRAQLGGSEVIELQLRRPDGPVAETADTTLAEALGRLPGVRGVRRAPDGYQLTVETVHRSLSALMALVEERQLPLERLTTHQATLEDVFVHLTGRQLRE